MAKISEEALQAEMESFFGDTIQTSKNTRDEELQKLGEALGTAFVEAIDFLAEMLRHDKINNMAKWARTALTDNRIAIVLDKNATRMSFKTLVRAVEQEGAPPRIGVCISLPPNWQEQIKEDPNTQMGGVVYILSQAVDYLHGKNDLGPEFEHVETDSDVRATLYEATFLRIVSMTEASRKYPFTARSQALIAHYPKGIDGPEGERLLYPYRDQEAPVN